MDFVAPVSSMFLMSGSCIFLIIIHPPPGRPSTAVRMRCRIVFFKIWSACSYSSSTAWRYGLCMCVCVWSCVCICGRVQSPAAKRTCRGCAFGPQWLASIKPLSSPPCSGSTGQEVLAWGASLFTISAVSVQLTELKSVCYRYKNATHSKYYFS